MSNTPGLGLRDDIHVGDIDDRAALEAHVRAAVTASSPGWSPPVATRSGWWPDDGGYAPSFVEVPMSAESRRRKEEGDDEDG